MTNEITVSKENRPAVYAETYPMKTALREP